MLLITFPTAGLRAQEAAAGADQGTAEEIVVTARVGTFGATKSQTPILETARSLSVETAQDFRDKGFLNLDDALGYTSGVTPEPFGFSTRGDFSTVRGLDVPEYRDNLQFLFGFYNNPRPDLYTLEQVEVLKGPASVLYGAGSPGGIINVVTKRPYADNAGEFVVEAGNFDRFQIATDLNGFIPGTGETGMARLVALYRDSGTQIDEVNDDKLVIAPSFTAQPADGTTITVLANYTEQKTDAAHQFYPVTGTLLPSADGRKIDRTEYLGEPGFNRYDSESLAITLIAEQRLTDNIALEGVGRYVDAQSEYYQSWPGFAGAGIPRIDADGNAPRSFFLSDRRSEQISFDVRVRADFETGALQHEVLAGIQYQDVLTDADNAFTRLGAINVFAPVYGNAPSEAALRALQFNSPTNYVEETGYYLNNQMTAGNVIVTLGLRLDQVENRVGGAPAQEDDAASFSAGVLYKLPHGISPYASYAESFEPVTGIDALTGEQLKPQEGRQYEIGIKWQPEGIDGLVTIAAFDIEQSNLPNAQALFGANTQQEGIAKIRGAEFEANVRIGGLNLDANVSYLDTESPEGRRLDSIPDFTASLFGIYRFTEGPLSGLRLGGGVRHVAGTESTDISLLTGDLIRYVTNGYTVGDAVIGYEVGKLDFSVNVRNLTNEDYLTTCLARGDCYPGERRSIVASAAYRF
ncbi:TonB-dependent siderophore receptor [Pacificimonas sp. WHA3]|uniref:TonB-dependent siderophore receptor n=1 Tax=Pacificimonas pallii TaxID=2827236 RepID=A0ABS6SFZ5_9SPHN|nr:TonB-dependent siderophore receptor [Pacificimonas pallii]